MSYEMWDYAPDGEGIAAEWMKGRKGGSLWVPAFRTPLFKHSPFQFLASSFVVTPFFNKHSIPGKIPYIRTPAAGKLAGS
jgi:hypothetical protein